MNFNVTPLSVCDSWDWFCSRGQHTQTTFRRIQAYSTKLYRMEQGRFYFKWNVIFANGFESVCPIPMTRNVASKGDRVVIDWEGFTIGAPTQCDRMLHS